MGIGLKKPKRLDSFGSKSDKIYIPFRVVSSRERSVLVLRSYLPAYRRELAIVRLPFRVVSSRERSFLVL